ncbi:zinc transporter ZIP1 [Passer montanus]|uniref:zinc transporter ZIP1 n=1 Tax=Passer montanus TaxID=9160 RepID=UPI0019617CE1|nr:zinc transporter ZIP1 [Passer montanus]
MAADTGTGAALAWSPAVAAQPPPGLAVKLGSLVLLLLLPLACGLAPLWCFRRPPGGGRIVELGGSQGCRGCPEGLDRAVPTSGLSPRGLSGCRAAGGGSLWGLSPPFPPEPRSPVLSLVSCFSGGVFMGTFLLDLLPDYLGSIAAALEGLRVTLQFPLPQFILAMGFFLVLVLEQATLAQRELPEPPEEESRALLPGASIQASAPAAPGAGAALRAVSGVWGVWREPRSPVLSLVSCFSGGVFMGTFLLDLLPDYLGSIAAALEGLRVTLQFPLPQFILAMGFFLVLVLEQATLAQRELPEPPEEESRALLPGASIQASAPAAPGAGAALNDCVGVGTALAAGAGPRQRLCRAVLEGLAAGTFLFVTFLEILPQELGAPGNRIPKVILILGGFALVSAILFVKG